MEFNNPNLEQSSCAIDQFTIKQQLGAQWLGRGIFCQDEIGPWAQPRTAVIFEFSPAQFELVCPERSLIGSLSYLRLPHSPESASDHAPPEQKSKSSLVPKLITAFQSWMGTVIVLPWSHLR